MYRRIGELLRDKKGFTGLEAAIVLIAFVTVAAVFSYVMLGAGFFTAQKGKQSVDVGVKQASSSLELDGQYIYLKANKTGSDGDVGKIYFYVTLSAGGTPIDLEQTVLALRYKDYYMQLPYGTMHGGDINKTESKITFTSISINRTKLNNSTSEMTDVGTANITVNITTDNVAVVNVTATNVDVYGMKSGDTFTGYILADVTGDINGTSITGKFYIALSGTVNGNYLNITTLTDGKLYDIVDNDKEELGALAFNLENSTADLSLQYKDTTGNYEASNEVVYFSSGKFGYMSWWYTGVVHIDTPTYDNLLEKNEKYEILINTTAIKKVKDLSTLPETNDYLTIELKPSIGSPLIINKQIPPSLTKLTWV